MAVTRAVALPVGPPVSRRWQIGREGDIARLAASLLQGDHAVLADLRRTGKTTVALGALDALAEDARNIIIAVDLSRAINDGDAFDEAVALQVAAQRSGVEKAARQAGGLAIKLWNMVRGTGVAQGEEADAIDAALRELTARAGGARTLGWAFDAAAELAADRGGRAIVFVDEAQLLDAWEDREPVAAVLLRRMREPEKPITFMFAGSEPRWCGPCLATAGCSNTTHTTSSSARSTLSRGGKACAARFGSSAPRSPRAQST
jgi:hypothetical protein